MFLEILQNSQENTCVRVSYLIKLQAEACNLIRRETGAQMFSCEFSEISKNTFFTEHLRTTASDYQLFMVNMLQRGFQNGSVDTWKLNKHCLLVYSIFECSHLQTLILTFTFSNKSVTLNTPFPNSFAVTTCHMKTRPKYIKTKYSKL